MKKTSRFLTILILLILNGLPARGQMRHTVNPPEMVAVFDAIYRYDLVEAQKRFQHFQATSIDQGLTDLTEANLIWWLMVSGDESKDYESLITSVLNRTIKRLSPKPLDKITADEAFFMIHAYAYLTRVDIYYNHYLKGIGNLGRVLPYLELALGQAEASDQYLLASGMYNYFARVAATRYPFLLPFFAIAPRADRDLGYRQLIRCAGMSNLMIRNEARYYLMKINYQMEDDFVGSLRSADQLVSAYPNNLLYRFHRFSILLDSGRKKQALEEYQRLLLASISAPGMNAIQRKHFTDIALKQLRKERINPAI